MLFDVLYNLHFIIIPVVSWFRSHRVELGLFYLI